MSTAATIAVLPDITAVVFLDVAHCTSSAEYRAAVAELDAIPSGATVVVNVGGALPNYEAVNHLLDHSGRVGISVWGSNATYLHEWMRALRDETRGYPA